MAEMSVRCYLTTKKSLSSFDNKPFSVIRHCGGDKRDRTADLLNAIQALSQLSYTPVFPSEEVWSLMTILNFLKTLDLLGFFPFAGGILLTSRAPS